MAALLVLRFLGVVGIALLAVVVVEGYWLGVWENKKTIGWEGIGCDMIKATSLLLPRAPIYGLNHIFVPKIFV